MDTRNAVSKPHRTPAGSFIAARAPGPLSGTIRVPGDKSISHRALMFGALAVGRTRIEGLLEGEDVLRTAAAMRALGAEITCVGAGAWEVHGRGIGALTEPEDVLDMGNSGTAARLLAGILATHPFVSVMTGDASLRRRPMRRVTEPLTATGATFVSRAGGRLPLAITGTGDALPIAYRVPVASAQVKSALLLAGLNARGTSVVEEPVATRDHSENMLRHFGATITVEPAGAGRPQPPAGAGRPQLPAGAGRPQPPAGAGQPAPQTGAGRTDAPPGAGRIITLIGQPELHGRDVSVPGDPSSAAFPLVAALLVPGSSITIEAVGLNTLRTGLLTTLREMGADITITARRTEGGEETGTITATHGPLNGVEVPPERAPSMIDEFPILAVAAACAIGTTRMRGLAELRVKESDRLAATAALLAANGARVEIEGDDLLVHGDGRPPAGGGAVVTHMDHRLAMSGIVLALVAEAPVSIDDVSFIDTSFPGFLDLMDRLGAGLR